MKKRAPQGIHCTNPQPQSNEDNASGRRVYKSGKPSQVGGAKGDVKIECTVGPGVDAGTKDTVRKLVKSKSSL